MKIKTQVSATLGGMVILLSIVAFGGYMAANIVSQAAAVHPTVLIPGIQNYNNMRYKTLEAAMAVYQRDAAKIRSVDQQIRDSVIAFGIVAEDSPFFGDRRLAEGLAYISETLLAVLDSALKEDLSTPPSASFIAAAESLEEMDVEANDIIAYLVNVTTQRINGAISTIVKAMVIVSLIAILIAAAAGIWLTRGLKRGMDSLSASFSQISSGDLTVTADASQKNELGEIAGYFNDLASTLKSTIRQLAEMMDTLAELSSRFKASGESFSDRAMETSDETQQVATAMTEMAATIREVAANAETTSNKAQEATEQAAVARSSVENSVQTSQKLQGQMVGISDQIIELKEKTASISSVIDVIQGIAEQTNLLALNAAIEAARAGEQGRGFAVVADEVRSLATRTAESTQEIVAVIKALQAMAETTAQQIAAGSEDVEANATAIRAIESSLLTILDNIAAISDMNHLVATNAQEQSHVAEDMNSNVVRISDLAEQNATQTGQIREDINTIDELTQGVRNLIAQFRY